MSHRDSKKRREWHINNIEYHSNYRQTNPEQFIQYNKTYRQKQRETMLIWYEKYKKTLKCSVCSENREPCLDFHHKDSDTKKFEIKRMMKKGTCSINTFFEEVEKCIILCANCHRMHHWSERHNKSDS